jgi:hypothetical protein
LAKAGAGFFLSKKVHAYDTYRTNFPAYTQIMVIIWEDALMTTVQKEHIKNLRSQGISYASIADTIGLSKNTVKSFCQRLNAPLKPAKPKAKKKDGRTYCRNCENEVPPNPGRKPKTFCSPECRTTWWAANPQAIKQRAVYNFICDYCKTPFTAYGNNKRKFCNHACYVASRFKKEATP